MRVIHFCRKVSASVSVFAAAGLLGCSGAGVEDTSGMNPDPGEESGGGDGKQIGGKADYGDWLESLPGDRLTGNRLGVVVVDRTDGALTYSTDVKHTTRTAGGILCGHDYWGTQWNHIPRNREETVVFNWDERRRTLRGEVRGRDTRSLLDNYCNWETKYVDVSVGQSAPGGLPAHIIQAIELYKKNYDAFYVEKRALENDGKWNAQAYDAMRAKYAKKLRFVQDHGVPQPIMPPNVWVAGLTIPLRVWVDIDVNFSDNDDWNKVDLSDGTAVVDAQCGYRQRLVDVELGCEWVLVPKLKRNYQEITINVTHDPGFLERFLDFGE